MKTKVYNKTPSYALGGKNIKLNEKMKLIKNRTKYINEKITRILNSLEINFDIKTYPLARTAFNGLIYKTYPLAE